MTILKNNFFRKELAAREISTLDESAFTETQMKLESIMQAYEDLNKLPEPQEWKAENEKLTDERKFSSYYLYQNRCTRIATKMSRHLAGLKRDFYHKRAQEKEALSLALSRCITLSNFIKEKIKEKKGALEAIRSNLRYAKVFDRQDALYQAETACNNLSDIIKEKKGALEEEIKGYKEAWSVARGDNDTRERDANIKRCLRGTEL